MTSAYKELIANNFIELCKEQPFSKIKVKDIIEKCDISKQTFYNHFKDKYELMEYTYKKITKLPMANPKGEWPNVLSKTLEYYRDNKLLLSSLIEYIGQNDFREIFYYSCKSYYTDILLTTYQNPLSEELEQALDYYCLGITNFFIQWVQEGMILSPEKYTARIISYIPHILYYPLYESLLESAKSNV